MDSTPTLVLQLPRKPDSLPTCSPNLMPFHIDYSGPAPISTYLRVQPAKEVVGAPPPAESSVSQIQTTTLSNNDGASDVAIQDGSEPSEVDKDEASTTLSSLAGGVSDATTRFISSFRGRTIQGLKVPLPPGYVGILMHSDDTEEGSSNTIRDERAANGRRTRSKSHRNSMDGVPDVIDVDEDEVKTNSLNSLLDEEAMRTLSITSQFSSFVLWRADHPVDETSDEYIRSINEWTRLAELIHKTPEDL